MLPLCHHACSKARAQARRSPSGRRLVTTLGEVVDEDRTVDRHADPKRCSAGRFNDARSPRALTLMQCRRRAAFSRGLFGVRHGVANLRDAAYAYRWRSDLNAVSAKLT